MAQLVPRSGNATTATDFAVHVAGAESNVAIGFARLNGHAEWVSRVGDDPFGRRVLTHISGEGVDTPSVEVDADRPTGCFLKDVTGEARPVTYFRTGSAASAMSISDADRALRSAPAVVHTSGVTAALSESCSAAVRHLAATAAASSVEFSFDVNYRPRLWSDQKTAASLLRDLGPGRQCALRWARRGRRLVGPQNGRTDSRSVSRGWDSRGQRWRTGCDGLP